MIVRAWDDSLKFLGSNTRKFVVGGALTIIAAAAVWYFHDRNQAIAKIEWWVLIAFSYIGVFALVYAVALIRAPYLLHEELLESGDAARQQANDLATKLESQNEKLALERDTALARDPKANVIRTELNHRRAGFERVRQALKAENTAAIDEFYNLDREAHNYIRQNVPGYTFYGRRYPVQNSYTRLAKYTSDHFREFIEKCDDRINTINDVISHF